MPIPPALLARASACRAATVDQTLALLHQAHSKAFTPALLASALGGRATDPILVEGGYVRFVPDDDAWWMPSGWQIVSKADFYLPVSFLDPFGNPPTEIAYDTYHLVVTHATDPVGNVVTALVAGRPIGSSGSRG